MSSNSTATDLIDFICTLDTCPLIYAYVEYVPTLIGNAIYLGIFACLLVAQIVLGIRYRTWGFLFGMCFGVVLEIIGYVGRIMLHSNPFDFNSFLLYLICLTIGPAFMTAAIYLCLGRIITAYGRNLSRFTPRTYTFVFIGCDFISLVLQAVGGALTSTSSDEQASNIGVDVMVAGLSFQIFSLAIFMGFCAEFAWRVKHNSPTLRESKLKSTRETWQFRGFLWALIIATIAIFIRCVFRVVELSNGFSGKIANNEVVFMIFEGPMIIIAVFALSVLHPGTGFQGDWKAAEFPIKSVSKSRDESLKSTEQNTIMV